MFIYKTLLQEEKYTAQSEKLSSEMLRTLLPIRHSFSASTGRAAEFSQQGPTALKLRYHDIFDILTFMARKAL